MSRAIRTGFLGLALLGLAGVAPAGAQSITSVRGLGYPLLPVDARSEIMGGLGIGLQGFAVPLTNPAGPAGVRRRGFVMAVENTSRDMSLGEASGSTDATRFPLLRMIFPLRDVVLTLGYGGLLDQSWGVTSAGEVTLGTGSTVGFSDVVQSTGGVGQFQVGAAVPLGEALALGATVGALTGNQRVRLTRRFDPGTVSDFEPFDETYGWRYSGATASLGARLRLGRAAQVGASATWAGTVTADSTDGRAADREFDLPLQFAAGASAYLGPALLAAVSARWSGWSASAGGVGMPGGGIATIEARDTWEVGAGLELDNPESRRTRSFPVRVGFQYRQLPFTFLEDAPSEWFAGAGIGMRLGTNPENPIALVDLAVQRGARTAAGSETSGDFDESVWRVGLSLSLFGN